jgi:hypothetical protein
VLTKLAVSVSIDWVLDSAVDALSVSASALGISSVLYGSVSRTAGIPAANLASIAFVLRSTSNVVVSKLTLQWRRHDVGKFADTFKIHDQIIVGCWSLESSGFTTLVT